MQYYKNIATRVMTYLGGHRINSTPKEKCARELNDAYSRRKPLCRMNTRRVDTRMQGQIVRDDIDRARTEVVNLALLP